METTMAKQERARRRELAERTRAAIIRLLPVEDCDESSVILSYNGFYLQIAFSELHPLMVLYMARTLNRKINAKDARILNELNLKSVLGSHAVNTETGCYSYRAAHWLDADLSEPRLREILERYVEEAGRAYNQLTV